MDQIGRAALEGRSTLSSLRWQRPPFLQASFAPHLRLPLPLPQEIGGFGSGTPTGHSGRTPTKIKNNSISKYSHVFNQIF